MKTKVVAIDFNSSDPKPFIKASRDILGNDNVYYMTAYGTMQESSAFRNMCRAKGLSMDEYNEVAKDLDKYRNNPKWKDIIEESKRFVGVIDSVSPHPCAVLLLDRPISEEMGVIKVGDELCAVIDSTTSDSWKYLKNDFLSVTVWDIIAKVFEVLGRPIPNIRELNDLVDGDDKIWELYEKGLTATLNQTGTATAIPQVTLYKPKSVRDLSGFVAAIRPSFESMKHYFLERKEFSYGIEEFDKILETSDNFVLYQENIMATLVYAGFEEDETYSLLKAIAKKKEGIIEPIQDRFIEGFSRKSGSVDDAKSVWKIIEDSVSYGFNSSHSLSVAYDSLYGAYLKANYPLEYFSTVLNIYEDNTDMTAQLLKELEEFDIKVINPVYGKSQNEYSFNKDAREIVKGLKSIKFMNEDVSKSLYDLSSSNEYNDFIDLLKDISEKTSINSRQINILIKLGFFRMFGGDKYLSKVYEKFGERFKKNHKDKTKEARIIEVKEYANSLNKDGEYSVPERIVYEKQMLGYAVSTDKDYEKCFGVVLDINTKFSPLVTLYNVKTGKEYQLKVSKQKFFKDNKTATVKIGDMIKVRDMEQKPKQKMVDGKWVTTDIMQLWLTSWELVSRINEKEKAEV